VLTGADVQAAAAQSAALLRPAVHRPWDAPVPELEFTVAGVVAHIAETILWYAIDLSARGADLACVEQRVQSDHPPDLLVDTVVSYAGILAAVVDRSPPETRGFHPFGRADPSGFAAMACDEVLIHTDDAARGLGLTFVPDTDLCARTLGRLFPWAPTDVDPWPALRWANGRQALAGRERLTRWRWHCAPLDEWDPDEAAR
jgi:uncharacterized protein (TIGR03083 family)